MLLPGRHYESEHTRFIRELHEKRPELAQRQREARAIWWDKNPSELAAERSLDAGRVAPAAYPYDNNVRG